MNTGGRTVRERIFVVTGKDTDNRFKIVGNINYPEFVTVGRSGYVEGSALKLRAATVFNLTEKGITNCSLSKTAVPILNMNSLGYFLETTTYTDTAQAKIELYNQREDRRTHNVGKDCIIGGR